MSCPTPRSSYPAVAVLGAAGFVGRQLLRELGERRIPVVAIVRGLRELAVDNAIHTSCNDPDLLPAGQFDLVINLAYPTFGKGYDYPRQTDAIVRRIGALVRPGGRVVHVSTLAVFGAALDRPIVTSRLPNARDDAYVESKVAAEHGCQAIQEALDLSLDIVRLGNVWGPGSGTWGLPLVHRLLTGRPVGITGSDGFSNTTDVVNAASYLAFLAESRRCRRGVRFHHVAEFSHVPWSAWIQPVAEEMGVDPAYIQADAIAIPQSAVREAVAVLAPLMPRDVYTRLAAQRVAGSWTRSFVRRLPASTRARLSRDLVFAAPLSLSGPDRTLLSILDAKQEFRPVMCSDWRPTITQDQSLRSFLRWLADE